MVRGKLLLISKDQPITIPLCIFIYQIPLFDRALRDTLKIFIGIRKEKDELLHHP